MTTGSDATWLSIDEIESAINRYRSVHARKGDEWFVMDPALSRMAHVYGQMIMDRSPGVHVESLDIEAAQLFLEWAGP
jgi:hypothetical protein